MTETRMTKETDAFGLRHTIATLAYRAAKALKDSPDPFSDFRLAEGSRSAGEILAHMSDLLDWALSLARGDERWNDSTPNSWSEDTKRFFAAATRLDEYLASARNSTHLRKSCSRAQSPMR